MIPSETLPAGLPVKTLGWGVLDWGSTFLAQPDGEHAGEAWRYTPEQARFVLWYYALDDFGRFRFRRAVLMRVKGWGKSPLLAALACTELLGPVAFAGWDAHGNPVGKPKASALVQLCGVSKDQADNTMSLVAEMLGQGQAVDEYDVDVGLTRVLAGSSRLYPVTASVKSREGQRPTFAVLDETGLWIPSNKGPELAATIRRNLGKVDGRSVETTNAPVPGQDSVAEDSWAYYEAIREGRVDDDTFLMDHRAVPMSVPFRDDQAIVDSLTYAYGDATWVNRKRVLQEIRDPATSEVDARRFYLNQIVKGADQWMDKARWELKRTDGVLIEPGEKISVGFDGSIRDDATALVGCRLRDGMIFPIKMWENVDDPDWEVDVLDVDATVRSVFERFRVVRFNADPAHWQDILGRWALEFAAEVIPGLPVVMEWWTNRPLAMARAIERFETATYAGDLRHSGDRQLTRHILNAHVEETAYGKRLRKSTRGSRYKIDGAIAAILAWEARAESINAGALDDNSNRNVVYGF